MSGWDDSRPTWERERRRPDGAPRRAPGAPPGVFDPDYDPFEPDYDPQVQAQQPYGQPGHARGDFAPDGWADPADRHDRDDGDGFADRDGDPGGPNGYGSGRHGRLAAAQENNPRPDHGQPHGWEDFPQLGYPARDQNGRDQAGWDFAARDTADPDHAARMDPALQDFFAPLPSRPDFAQPGRQPGRLSGPQPGAQRSGQPAPARPTRPNQPPHRQPGQPGQPGQPPQPPQSARPTQEPRPPWPGDQAAPASHWDAAAPRPGSRAARRQDRRPPRRGLAMASAAVGVVVVLGIAAAAYLLLHKSAASTPPAAAPTTSHMASPAGQSAGQSARYTLSTPATAGGYPQVMAPPSAVSSVATATAQVVRGQAVTAGGKVTSQVAAYYQLDSGQVMSFAGYDGTFDPAKVLAALGSDWATFPAGPHGGDLACTPSAGTPGGTVCVWATTTTLGVTEFFASTDVPEIVTVQAKAAQDTVNVRADVEAAKS